MEFPNKKRLKACTFGVFLSLAVSPAMADEACDAEITAINDAIAAPAQGVNAGDIEQAQIMLDMVAERCASGATIESVEGEVSAIKLMLKMG
jgi:hypothetical protein